MSNLWIFGCSFSAEFDTYPYLGHDGNSNTWYRDWRKDKTLPPVWSQIVGEKLGLNVINKAEAGNSNYKIFKAFCENLHDIQEGDTVIFEWSRVARFNVEYDGNMTTMMPWILALDHQTNVSKKFISEIFVDRVERCWIDEIYSYMNFIKEHSIVRNYELFFWSADDVLINSELLSFKQEWKCLMPEADEDMVIFLTKKYGAKSITNETNGVINDPEHYGEIGHKVMGDLFHKWILKYRDE